MENLINKTKTFIGDIFDDLKYDVLKFPWPEFSEIPIPQHLDLKLYKESNGAWVESVDLPDFYATADSVEGLPLAIHQTILLYCGVPRYFARKQPKTGHLTLPDGSTISLIESIEDKLKYA